MEFNFVHCYTLSASGLEAYSWSYSMISVIVPRFGLRLRNKQRKVRRGLVALLLLHIRQHVPQLCPNVTLEVDGSLSI